MDLHPLLKLNFVLLSMTVIFILALLFNEVNYVFGHKTRKATSNLPSVIWVRVVERDAWDVLVHPRCVCV